MQNPNKIQKFSHETNFLVTNKRNYHNTLIQIYQIWKKKMDKDQRHNNFHFNQKSKN